MDSSIHRIKFQIGQLAKLLQEIENERSPSQPEEARELAILQNEKVLGDSNNEATIEENENVQTEGMGEKELEKEYEVEVTNPEPRPQLPKSPKQDVPPIPLPGSLKNSKLVQSHQDIHDLLYYPIGSHDCALVVCVGNTLVLDPRYFLTCAGITLVEDPRTWPD
ncbi:hypothetical protein QYF36_024786 [Acer negundo]|nr:hypothetical protein QYF36_024786 [Acer negundo]